MSIDASLLREIIMDHYEYPRNKSLTDQSGYASVHMASDSCIDDITVQSKIENGIIQDVRFDGVACTIATSSTSIMSELMQGKSIEEAIAFQNVGKQANRIHCATIGWKAMDQMIRENEGEKDESR